MAPIVIDGMIAAGKTSVLDLLEKKCGLTVHREPVESWTPWLERAYQKKTSHFSLQVRIMLDTCTQSPDADVVERSAALQPSTFIPALITADGHNGITYQEADLLIELHKKILAWTPEGTIVLMCSLEESIRRINERGRACEQGIDVAYLSRLHNLYMRLTEANPDIVVVQTDNLTPWEVAQICSYAIRRFASPL